MKAIRVVCQLSYVWLVLVFFYSCDSFIPKKTYYPNGNVKEESYLSGGVKHGLSTKFFETGEVESKTTYENGKIVGERFYYYKSGELENESIYENGILSGKHTEYYKSGEIKNQTTFVNGEQNGLTKVYHENGNVKKEQYFKNGHYNGDFKQYDSLGNLSFYALYDMDSVLFYSRYDEKGKLKKIYYTHKIEPLSDTIMIGEHKVKIILPTDKHIETLELLASFYPLRPLTRDELKPMERLYFEGNIAEYNLSASEVGVHLLILNFHDDSIKKYLQQKVYRIYVKE